MNTESHHGGFPLDDYDLVAPLGRGAMGEVWRGVHRGQGASVAVKVLTGPLARKPQYLTAFREEVRAVAMLDHPHIVTVYDYGHVTAASSRASGERYPEGSPYLVMELVDGGSMGQICGRTGWVELYQMLVALLDALGHAHARGLVHRDLKPHNVLVPAEGPAHGVRLTDFGLAHALYRDSDPFREHMAGTPNYMAPEQVRCAWRDYGPWTDLYALGCIAYALVSGKPPFRRLEPQDTLQAHLYVPAPPIAREGLPAGFEAWVHRLLAKDPAERYQRAADAAWALMRLAEGHVGGPGGGVSSRPDLPQMDSDPASDPTEAASSVHTLTWRWDDWAGRGTAEAPVKAVELPPIPGDWRRDEAVGWNPLLGVGLGLYGLRTVPLVDRYDERDALWAALRAAAGGRPRAVVLRGPAGMGKSRLGEWLGERADELGAALVLRAVHNPIPGPRDGLGPMFARFHVCAGLDREAADARLETILRDLGEAQEDAWHPLAALVAPEQGERLSSADRYRVIEAHLRRLARRRPVVMLVDDAQWGPEAVAVTRRLIDCAELRLLVVLTIEEASRMAEAGARHALEKLGDHPAVQVLAVGSLPSGHRPALVQALLGLECEVAAEVEGRTEGSPLFAIHLVGDWVQRGALVPGAQGFTLRPGVAQRLPDGIHDIWRQRIDEVLAGRPAGDRLALELAAMLGRDVDADEWRTACAQAAPAASGDLVELLVARRLGVQAAGEVGWSFAHAMLRESLLRRIDEQGRAAGCPRCARRCWRGGRGRGSRSGGRSIFWGRGGRRRRSIRWWGRRGSGWATATSRARGGCCAPGRAAWTRSGCRRTIRGGGRGG
ncbi:MAG: protein kinase [bacterium]